MSLQLSGEEREVLLEVLNDRLGELRQEIHHSMVSTFTDQLKRREELLKDLIAKVESCQPSASAES